LKDLLEEPAGTVISPELIKKFHQMVGNGIGETFAAAPGAYRTNNVVAGNVYKPPPADQINGLLIKLCDWLKRQFHCGSDQNFDEAVIQAMVTHVYITWIHPFGDGNGRTVRLLEFYLLLRGGIPNIASHILSNHYNETRSGYYRRLQEATETGNLTDFFRYALTGFRDGLEGVLKVIHENQIDITWRNYVHDRIEALAEEKTEKVLDRIRQLAYYIPGDTSININEIRTVHIKLAVTIKGFPI
jgi:Fic family protein